MVEREQGCDTIVVDGCEGCDRYRRNSHPDDCFFPVCCDRVFHDSFTFSFATNYLVFVDKLALSGSFQSPKSVLREFWFSLDSELDPARTHARRGLSKTWAPLLRIARFAS